MSISLFTANVWTVLGTATENATIKPIDSGNVSLNRYARHVMIYLWLPEPS